MIETHISEIMTTSVRTIRPDTDARTAAEVLSENQIGSLIVVNEADEPVGIFTESDIVRIIAEGSDASSVEVSEFMSSPLVTAESDEVIQDAARKMKEENIKKLPVIDDGKLVGIITTTDLSDYIPRSRI
ncbi:MAG: CBS domain-containing protein [Halobacteria archaeon]|nr:CBS domain-containing protein [Halobacteria archaeon]